MNVKLSSVIACLVVGLSAGSAYALSCAWPATIAVLTPVAVTVDGVPAEPGTSELRLSAAEDPSGPARIVVEDDPAVTIQLEEVLP